MAYHTDSEKFWSVVLEIRRGKVECRKEGKLTIITINYPDSKTRKLKPK